MIPTWAFPVVSIVLSVGSAVVYAAAGDVRQAIYWTAAAVITASVTF